MLPIRSYHHLVVSYKPNITELLWQLNCTIAISTFQAGKEIFISPKNVMELVQLPRAFNLPMGITMGQSEMAVSTYHEVIYYRSSKDLAISYPDNPDDFDEIWIPSALSYRPYRYSRLPLW